MIGKLIAQGIRFMSLPFAFGEQERRLQDWVRASNVNLNNLPTAEGLMVVLNVRTDDDDVVRHAKMMAICYELQNERDGVLANFDAFAAASNQRLQSATAELEAWRKAAETLTAKLRDNQLELDKLRTHGG